MGKSVAKNEKNSLVLRLQKAILIVNLLLLSLVISIATDFKLPSFALAKDTPAVVANESGLVLYSPNKLSDKKTNILFFNASWCPHCKATIQNLKLERANLDPDLNILSIDPDAQENANLMAKYQVTGFPTFVKVDKDGNQIEKWSGETTVAALNSKK